MPSTAIDPALDLTIERLIRATPADVWRAWTDPALFAQWWIPAPMVTKVVRLDVAPGGGFVTEMSEDGLDFMPHMDAAFLLVEPESRLVFTNTVTCGWHPANPRPVALTSEILLEHDPEGTLYRAIARHGDAATRELHEELGFYPGWGATLEGLARVVEN